MWHIFRLALVMVVLVLVATPSQAAQERPAASGQITIIVVDITGARLEAPRSFDVAMTVRY